MPRSTATNVYFDTEFTSLLPDAKLISIGMVDQPGRREFYREVRGVDYSVCSNFCLHVVLPLLEGGEKSQPLHRLRADLVVWLGALGPTTLICDSPRDIVQLRSLLPEGLPPGCTVRVMGFWAKWRRRILTAGDRLHSKHGLRPHHSLDDARANRLALGHG